MDGLGGLVALVAFVVLFFVIALTIHTQLPRHEFLEPRRGAAIMTPFLALLALIVHRRDRPS